MSEHAYEALFILDSNRYARNPGAVSQQLNDIITRNGGTILVSRLWEERRLAYPINGQRKGTYWLTYFRGPADKLTTLNREFHLDENIMRSLVLKVDPRIVDTLVAHANAGPVDPARARRPEPAPVEPIIVPEEEVDE